MVVTCHHHNELRVLVGRKGVLEKREKLLVAREEQL